MSVTPRNNSTSGTHEAISLFRVPRTYPCPVDRISYLNIELSSSRSARASEMTTRAQIYNVNASDRDLARKSDVLFIRSDLMQSAVGRSRAARISLINATLRTRFVRRRGSCLSLLFTWRTPREFRRRRDHRVDACSKLIHHRAVQLLAWTLTTAINTRLINLSLPCGQKIYTASLRARRLLRTAVLQEIRRNRINKAIEYGNREGERNYQSR